MHPSLFTKKNNVGGTGTIHYEEMHLSLLTETPWDGSQNSTKQNDDTLGRFIYTVL